MTLIERVARAAFAEAERRGRMAGYAGPMMKWETESEALHEDWRAVARVAIAEYERIDAALAEKPDEHGPPRA